MGLGVDIGHVYINQKQFFGFQYNGTTVKNLPYITMYIFQ